MWLSYPNFRRLTCFNQLGLVSPLLNWKYRVTPPPIPQYRYSPQLRLFTETAQTSSCFFFIRYSLLFFHSSQHTSYSSPPRLLVHSARLQCTRIVTLSTPKKSLSSSLVSLILLFHCRLRSGFSSQSRKPKTRCTS